MNFVYAGTDDADYEHTDIIILDGNITNRKLIICKVKFGGIDSKNALWQDYYIICFNSSIRTLQHDLNIYGQVIYSGEIDYKGTYFYL